MVVYICQNVANIHFKWVHFIVCKLCFNPFELRKSIGKYFYVIEVREGFFE